MNKSIFHSPLYILFPFLFLEALFPDSQLKFLIRLPMYSFLVFVPLYYKSFFKNTNSKVAATIILLLFYYGIFLIFRSLLYDDNKAVFGNPITTLFGNTQVGAIVFLLPLIVVFSMRKEILNELYEILKIILAISIFVSIYKIIIFDIYSFNFLLILQCISFLYLYFPYIKNKRFLSLIIFGTVLMLILVYINGERALFLSILFSLFSFIGIKYIKSKYILKTSIILIIVISCLILIYGLYYKVSIFEVIKLYFSDDNDIAVDSRTFLYFEFSEDFFRHNSWLFGKGILGSYYSETMDIAMSNGEYSDFKNRIGIETGFLQYILKGGLLYLISYMLLLIFAIFNAFKYSKNDFLKIAALILAGRFFISTISEYPCFDLKNIVVWILIGLCINKKTLNLSNDDVKKIIYNEK